jgi:hypothetical protein
MITVDVVGHNAIVRMVRERLGVGLGLWLCACLFKGSGIELSSERFLGGHTLHCMSASLARAETLKRLTATGLYAELGKSSALLFCLLSGLLSPLE